MYLRVDAVVAGADPDAVYSRDLFDVSQMRCRERGGREEN
jgi:hypothetical protein